MLAFGSFGVVYLVENTAVKVGWVPQEEVENQEWVFYQTRRALPIWAYVPAVKLPREVTREACPIHGKGQPRETWRCHCGEQMAVMVMPLADRFEETPELLADRDQAVAQLEAAKKQFSRRLWWEQKNANLVVRGGAVNLVDFGPNNDAAAAW